MILNKEDVLGLGVDQTAYDAVSLNRKSTFINIFDENNEFVVSVNSLDMKGGADYLFLSEVLRAAELNNLVELNSLVNYKGLLFRLSAVQTSELQTSLKRNLAKREDFQKKSQPVQPAPIQQQAVF